MRGRGRGMRYGGGFGGPVRLLVGQLSSVLYVNGELSNGFDSLGQMFYYETRDNSRSSVNFVFFDRQFASLS